MGILLDSDKAGIALGLLVFVIIVLMGLHGNVPPAVALARAFVGFTVAYFLGFTLSKWITSALISSMATDRAKRLVERTKNRKENEKEGAKTESPGGST
jgi:xanthosine utilization system XapX-like protein